MNILTVTSKNSRINNHKLKQTKLIIKNSAITNRMLPNAKNQKILKTIKEKKGLETKPLKK